MNGLRSWACLAAACFTVPAAAQQVVPLAGPAAIWRASCAYCHDRGVGPALGGRGLPAAASMAIVRQGARGMPAFHRSEIGEQELVALAEWLERMPPPKAP
jgi:cytochrome c553